MFGVAPKERTHKSKRQQRLGLIGFNLGDLFYGGPKEHTGEVNAGGEYSSEGDPIHGVKSLGSTRGTRARDLEWIFLWYEGSKMKVAECPQYRLYIFGGRHVLGWVKGAKNL